jgi:hypothetical protein
MPASVSQQESVTPSRTPGGGSVPRTERMAAAAESISRAAPTAELGGIQSCGGSAKAISTRSSNPALTRAERSPFGTSGLVMPSMTRTSMIAVMVSGCMNGVMPPLIMVPMLTVGRVPSMGCAMPAKRSASASAAIARARITPARSPAGSCSAEWPGTPRAVSRTTHEPRWATNRRSQDCAGAPPAGSRITAASAARMSCSASHFIP